MKDKLVMLMTTHRKPKRRDEANMRFLTYAEALRFTNAALFAEHQGHWLNSLITITWTKMPGFEGNGPEELQRCVRAAIKTLTDAHGGGRTPLHYAWVKEMGPTKRTGIHVHIFVHLDPARFNALVDDIRNRLRSRFDLKDHGVAVSTGNWGRPGFRTRTEIQRQLIYALKGLGPDEAVILPSGEERALRWYLDIDGAKSAACLKASIHPLPAPWSTWGKAVGASNSLGPAARSAARWIELATPQDLREALWQGYSTLNDAVPPPTPWSRLRSASRVLRVSVPPSVTQLSAVA